jgi:hypothetical protein
MLVFVDFSGQGDFDRPDFYILTVKDWRDFVEGIIARHPHEPITIREDNVLVWNGGKYFGSGVSPDQIQDHKERWDKIIEVVG